MPRNRKIGSGRGLRRRAKRYLREYYVVFGGAPAVFPHYRRELALANVWGWCRLCQRCAAGSDEQCCALRKRRSKTSVGGVSWPCNVHRVRAGASGDLRGVRLWNARFCRRCVCGRFAAWNAACDFLDCRFERMCLWGRRAFPTGPRAKRLRRNPGSAEKQRGSI
jgi:hypothetical protein